MSCRTNRWQETHTVAEGSTNSNTVGDNQTRSQQSKWPKIFKKLINYFYSSANTDADKRKSSDMTQKIHDTFSDVFNGIGCLDSKPYQAPPWHVAYVLQKLFKEELEWLQEMDIIAPLGVDQMAEWCNSFALVPKANGKMWLCLDPAWLNQALIRPIHRGPTLNDILPRHSNMPCMSIINASLGSNNLKLDEQLSYLTTFACPFGRYQYKWLPFRAVLVGDMFQCKINEIFNDMPNVYGIADDILVIGYDKDETDHDDAVYKSA